MSLLWTALCAPQRTPGHQLLRQATGSTAQSHGTPREGDSAAPPPEAAQPHHQPHTHLGSRVPRAPHMCTLQTLGCSAHGHVPNLSLMAALQASPWWALGSPLLGNTQLLRPQSFWDPRSAHISDTNATSTTRALIAVPYAKMDPFKHNTLNSREKDQEVPSRLH